jgi:DNA-3-methyladenine glycosylase
LKQIPQSFFQRDVLEVAPDLLGKTLVRKFPDGRIQRFTISEVEAYRGGEDLACHASKGRTPRTEVMFWEGGYIYIYLIYGMYHMLNFVTGEKESPQAVLIRGLKEISGPGRLTKKLQINKSLNQTLLSADNSLWLEEGENTIVFETSPRVGIDYAGEPWKSMPWRYSLKLQ